MIASGGTSRPSPESGALAALYVDWNARRAANKNDTIGFMRSLFPEWADLATEAPGVSFETIDGPVAGLRVLPGDADESSAILYIHGGGYIGGSSGTHRKVAAHFAHAIGSPAFVVDYRLAPENRYPAQLEDVRAAFDALLDTGIPASRIIVIGDSAGGALATALAMQLRDTGMEVPGAVVALSPYYDSEARGDSFATNQDRDVFAGARGRGGISANIGMVITEESQREHPYLSALRGDFHGLPPHIVSVGSDELLTDGARMFAERARADGVEVELEVVDRMQHVFHFMVGRAPEADASVQAIARFVRAHVPLSVTA